MVVTSILSTLLIGGSALSHVDSNLSLCCRGGTQGTTGFLRSEGRVSSSRCRRTTDRHCTARVKESTENSLETTEGHRPRTDQTLWGYGRLKCYDFLSTECSILNFNVKIRTPTSRSIPKTGPTPISTNSGTIRTEDPSEEVKDYRRVNRE